VTLKGIGSFHKNCASISYCKSDTHYGAVKFCAAVLSLELNLGLLKMSLCIETHVHLELGLVCNAAYIKYTVHYAVHKIHMKIPCD